MISDELARALRAAGLVWHPESGDRFRIEAELLTDMVFTLSDMTIEAHTFETGTVLGFNGTTEWALDSVDVADALWLPREDQLRDLLRTAFVRLEREQELYRVVLAPENDAEGGTAERVYESVSAPEAYGLALLAVLDRVSA